jgi:hypothetical protein
MPIASFFALDGDEDTVAILDFSEGAFDKGQVLLFKVCQIGNYYFMLCLLKSRLTPQAPKEESAVNTTKVWFVSSSCRLTH